MRSPSSSPSWGSYFFHLACPGPTFSFLCPTKGGGVVAAEFVLASHEAASDMIASSLFLVGRLATLFNLSRLFFGPSPSCRSYLVLSSQRAGYVLAVQLVHSGMLN